MGPRKTLSQVPRNGPESSRRACLGTSHSRTPPREGSTPVSSAPYGGLRSRVDRFLPRRRWSANRDGVPTGSGRNDRHTDGAQGMSWAQASVRHRPTGSGDFSRDQAKAPNKGRDGGRGRRPRRSSRGRRRHSSYFQASACSQDRDTGRRSACSGSGRRPPWPPQKGVGRPAPRWNQHLSLWRATRSLVRFPIHREMGPLIPTALACDSGSLC